MKVMVQPVDGIALLLSGIKSAKKSIEIVIFRLDQSELEAALEAAIARPGSAGAHRLHQPGRREKPAEVRAALAGGGRHCFADR